MRGAGHGYGAAAGRIIDQSLVSDASSSIRWSENMPTTAAVPAELDTEAPTGIEIVRATMCGWIMRIGDLLIPVSAAMRKELLAGSYMQADETPVDVQTHDGRGTNHQAYLWQYGKPGGATVFDFRMSRGAKARLTFWMSSQGYCRLTPMLPMIAGSAVPTSCTPAAGRMREGGLWTRSSLISRMSPRCVRWN